MDRRPHRCNRVSLGRGTRRALREIATEFVGLKVDVIVTAGTDAVVAAKKATSVIPIVFGTAGDPVANGLVASLARPGGNVTGLSVQSADIAGKRIELLRERLSRAFGGWGSWPTSPATSAC